MNIGTHIWYLPPTPPFSKVHLFDLYSNISGLNGSKLYLLIYFFRFYVVLRFYLQIRARKVSIKTTAYVQNNDNNSFNSLVLRLVFRSRSCPH